VTSNGLTRRTALGGAISVAGCVSHHSVNGVEWTDLDGGVRALTNNGSGPWRIVAVPGAPCQPEFWQEVVAGFGRDAELLVMQRPGYAAGEGDAALSLSSQVDAMLAALGTGDEPRLLVGQSYAAPLAAYVAATYPEKVDRLMIMSGWFLPLRGSISWFNQHFGELEVLPRRLRTAHKEADAHDVLIQRVEPLLPLIRSPTTIMHDRRDTITPEANVRWLEARLAPGVVSDIRWASSGGHFLPPDVPDEVISALRAAIA
jgi:pimeloyl-ACP methyl ester carboxylesterase